MNLKQRILSWMSKTILRDTVANLKNTWLSSFRFNNRATETKLSVEELRNLSRTPIVRSAINQIREGILALPWEVVSIDGNANKKQIKQVTQIIQNPNPVDDYNDFIGKLFEDLIVLDLAFFEQKVVKGYRPLYLFPIDTETIEVATNWSGDLNQPRFLQSVNGHQEWYKVDKIAMLQRTKLTYDEFGLSPLEQAYRHIKYLAEVQEYANDISSNAMPKYLVNMGASASEEEIEKIRLYIANEIQGQSAVAIVGSAQLDAKQISPIGDEAASLNWQKMLLQIIATCFNIPPERLGVAISNDRSTSSEKDNEMLEYTIKPWAKIFERAFNKYVIARLGYSDSIKFQFVFTPTKAQQADAVERVRKLVDGNIITLNEARQELNGVLGIELKDIPSGDSLLEEYKSSLIQKRVQDDEFITDTTDELKKSTEKGEADEKTKSTT